MSIFGKLFKKKDEFSFDSNDNFSATNTSSNPDPLATQSQSPFGNPSDPLSSSAGSEAFGSDPFSATGPSSTTIQQSSNPFDKLPGATPASFGGNDIPNTTGMPQHSATSSAAPLPPVEDAGTTTGSQIARDYIRRQQSGAQPQQTPSTQNKDTSLEMINLKLDAIRSQLETLNHRLEKLEHEPKRLWK